MSELVPQEVTLTCPVCGSPIQTELYNLIDVGVNPELKAQLLRGRVNVARCPNCGSEGLVAAPILYHDPEKELLLSYVPQELDLQEQERHRVIGDLTNVILSYLPPGERKGYLLMPQEMLSYERLLERVLEAEGITPEVMAAQRERVALIEQLQRAMDQEGELAEQIEAVDEQLDFEFFATLGAYIESRRQEGHVDQAHRLEELRERLLEASSYGRQVIAQMLQGTAGPPPLSREDLLGRLLEAETDEELIELVTWYRGGVDYLFFQMLTERLEAAQAQDSPEEAQRLRDLRQTLLEVTEQIDQETRAALERASELLGQLLEVEDPERLIRAHLEEFNDAFFIVLGANLQAAEGNEEVYQRLQQLGNLVLEIAQENLPPEVRLIRQLLFAPDDEAALALLEEHASLVDDEIIALMRELSAESEDEIAGRLRELAELAEDWMAGSP